MAHSTLFLRWNSAKLNYNSPIHLFKGCLRSATGIARHLCVKVNCLKRCNLLLNEHGHFYQSNKMVAQYTGALALELHQVWSEYVNCLSTLTSSAQPAIAYTDSSNPIANRFFNMHLKEKLPCLSQHQLLASYYDSSFK